MSVEKTFIIYCNKDEITVGSIVSLRQYIKNRDGTYNWLSGSGLIKSMYNPAEPDWNNNSSYKVYCKTMDGSYKKYGEKVYMNDTIGLYCMGQSKFLSINPTTFVPILTDVTTGDESIGFIVSCPNPRLNSGVLSVGSTIRLNSNFSSITSTTSSSPPYQTIITTSYLHFLCITSTGSLSYTTNTEPDSYNKFVNYPFIIQPLSELYTGNGNYEGQHIDKWVHSYGGYRTVICRPKPPPGYVSLGDILYTIPNVGINYPVKYTSKVYAVFVKQKEDGSGPYGNSIRSTGFEYVIPTTYDNSNKKKITDFCNDDDDIVYISSSVDKSYNNVLYKGIGMSVISSTWSYAPKNTDIFWALHPDYCQSVAGTEADEELRKSSALKTTPFYRGGRMFGSSINTRGRCDYELWSTAVIFDRSGLDEVGGQIEQSAENGWKIYTSLIGGYAGRYGIKDFGGDWETNIQNSFNNTPLYILYPEARTSLCCRNADIGFECGVGSQKLKAKTGACNIYGSNICKASNEQDFSSIFCQRDVCKTSPLDDGINCDNEYKLFCNKKDTSGKYYNYMLYPDLCACFMTGAFLKPLCDTYATGLGISRNKKARQALGIDTSDPTSCINPCEVNPLCKAGAQIPSSRSKTRAGNTVVLGSAGIPLKCQNTELCIQDVTVNNDGIINNIQVNQNANCQTALQSVCIEQGYTSTGSIIGNVVYSPCTGSSGISVNNILTFKKKIIKDTTGECGDLGKEFICSEFDISSKTDSCLNGKRKVEYLQMFKNASVKDTMNSILTFATDAVMKSNGMTGVYDVISKKVSLTSNCKDCEVGLQPLNQDCEIKNGIWMQAAQMTKTITSPLNGGKACNFDTTTQYIGCEKDKDCIIEFKSSDSGCINGSRQYRYTIKAPSSGNGKSCIKAVLDILPASLKDSAVIDIDYSSGQAIATISCENCIVDYVIDTSVNNGQCALTGGQYLLTKVAKVVKEPVGGVECSVEQKSLIGKKKVETCTYNQDCIIDKTVVSDECDDITGVRLIKHKIKQPSVGNGKSCEEQSTDFGFKNYPTSKKIEYDSINSMINIETECPVSKDCIIDWTKKTNYIDKQKGLSVDIYPIDSLEQGRGKTCDKLSTEKYEGNLLYSQAEEGKMYVYSEYKAPASNIYLYIGIIALVFIIVIVMIIIK